MHTNTVTLTPDNFAQAKAAILYALSEKMEPTFTWHGQHIGMTHGKTYSFVGFDKDGDLQFKNNDNTICYASSSNCSKGWFELNITPEKLAEYSQRQMAQAITNLQQLKRTFEIEHALAAGDVIQWKPRMRDRPFPEYGAPVIVLETISPPRQTSDEYCSSDAPTKYDLVVGIIMDGVFRHYYADSRRFERVPQ
ncbi:hypothetical protein ACW5WK_03650 [Aeromonas enteropelogenes]|uniref:hypothetical protein n=1 Tax=Aeromonas enteropelogenes TaxID=29489 RepID=UPI0005AA482F|nr:hypothetical protein [Aeromonas enteropelogenes]UBH57119.1 hypothetical protein LA341_04140 [Aeromonas enteropelogenes]